MLNSSFPTADVLQLLECFFIFHIFILQFLKGAQGSLYGSFCSHNNPLRSIRQSNSNQPNISQET